MPFAHLLLTFCTHFFFFLKYNLYTVEFAHLRFTSQWFLLHSQNHATSSQINFRIFSLPQKEALFSLAVFPSLFFSLALGNHPILDISYKWNHVICDPLVFGFFHGAEYSWFIPVVAHSIPFQDWMIFSIWLAIPHSVYPFIGWWTLRWFSLFWLFLIMMLWTFLYKFCEDIHFALSRVCYLEVELLDQMVILFNLLRN